MGNKLPFALALSLGVMAGAQAEEMHDHAAHAEAGGAATPEEHAYPSAKRAMDHAHGGTSGMPMSHDGHHAEGRPAQYSRTPIPVLTDADRAAAFPPVHNHSIHNGAGINSFVLIDRLEWQDADKGNAFDWSATGWIGGNINRLWFRSDGERTNGVTEQAELQAFWGHAIGPWWDLLAGVRQDFKPGSPQTWGAIGLQGLALYDFEAEATAYFGEGGQTALRLEGNYDIRFTNRLILQPRGEVNLYGKNDPARGVGSGLSDAEAGLRLRYEIRREFAPYVGVSWTRAFGNSADLLRDEGQGVSDTRLVAGLRAWF